MSSASEVTTLGVEAVVVVTRVELRPAWLRVHFSDKEGDHADYHYHWLRHNCDLDRHPSTRERTVCSSLLPENPVPTAVDILASLSIPESQAGIRITWPAMAPLPTGAVAVGEAGGAVSSVPGTAADATGTVVRQSTYTAEWLRAHAYAYGRVDVPPPPSQCETVVFSSTGMDLLDMVKRALTTLREHGLAVVTGYGRDTERLIDAFADTGLFIRGSHFGRIEDLRTDNTTNKNSDQLGYTDYPVHLHTDQPFIDEPPRYQLLQCMTPADVGGGNYLINVRKAAMYLQATDRQAFELLATVPIRFHRKQRAFESLVVSPLLTLNHPKYGFIARYSYFTMDPHQVGFDLMTNWYRAYNTCVSSYPFPGKWWAG